MVQHKKNEQGGLTSHYYEKDKYDPELVELINLSKE